MQCRFRRKLARFQAVKRKRIVINSIFRMGSFMLPLLCTIPIILALLLVVVLVVSLILKIIKLAILIGLIILILIVIGVIGI